MPGKAVTIYWPVLLEQAGPGKSRTWWPLLGTGYSLQDSTLLMPTWQWGSEMDSATRRNLCFAQAVDYRKDVDAQPFISGILPQERADKVVDQKNLPNKQGTFDTGQQLTMDLETTISFLFLS